MMFSLNEKFFQNMCSPHKMSSARAGPTLDDRKNKSRKAWPIGVLPASAQQRSSRCQKLSKKNCFFLFCIKFLTFGRFCCSEHFETFFIIQNVLLQRCDSHCNLCNRFRASPKWVLLPITVALSSS